MSPYQSLNNKKKVYLVNLQTPQKIVLKKVYDRKLKIVYIALLARLLLIKINSHTQAIITRPNTNHTGSAIRNWYKVKTWLDQMFWQFYQKLMLSGFLSSGNLCLIHHLKLFWPHAASTASDRKGAKI